MEPHHESIHGRILKLGTGANAYGAIARRACEKCVTVIIACISDGRDSRVYLYWCVGRLSVGLHCVRMSLDEHQRAYKGTVRTLSVASRRGQRGPRLVALLDDV